MKATVFDFSKSNKGEVSERDLTASEIENGRIPTITDEVRMREKRNILLAETDWWAVSDRKITDEEKNYRQHLRDIPSQSGFPKEIDWGTKPE